MSETYDELGGREIKMQRIQQTMREIKYFYESEDGKLRRYVYCTMCQAGPFKEEEQGYSYIDCGQPKTPLNYCRSCAGSLRLSQHFKPNLPKKEEVKVVEKPIEKPVIKPIEAIILEEDIDEMVVETPDPTAVTELSVEAPVEETKEPDFIDEKFGDIEPSEEDIEASKEFIDEVVKTAEKLEVEAKEKFGEPVQEKPKKKAKTEKKIDELVIDKKSVENTSRKGIKILNRIEAKDDTYYFILVRCLDNTLYSSIGADVAHSIKNMNQGKGSDYTKPKTRRPVQLLYTQEIKGKKEATVIRNKFEKFSDEEKQGFISNPFKIE